MAFLSLSLCHVFPLAPVLNNKAHAPFLSPCFLSLSLSLTVLYNVVKFNTKMPEQGAFFDLNLQHKCPHTDKGIGDPTIVCDSNSKSPIMQSTGMFCVLTLPCMATQPKGKTWIKQKLRKNLLFKNQIKGNIFRWVFWQYDGSCGRRRSKSALNASKLLPRCWH